MDWDESEGDCKEMEVLEARSEASESVTVDPGHDLEPVEGTILFFNFDDADSSSDFSVDTRLDEMDVDEIEDNENEYTELDKEELVEIAVDVKDVVESITASGL